MLLRPVLFIHGFDGRPQHWYDDGFPQFLIEQGGFDPALIRCFSFGNVKTPEEAREIYNNEGDMRLIASRLTRAASDAADDVECVIERLSARSVAKGGPEKIDLVCHSIGGLIARYYLACKEADEYGTSYGGKVRRVVMIATPQRGLHSLDFAQAIVPQGSLLRRVLDAIEKLPWMVGKFSGRLADLDTYWRKVLALASKELRDPHTETQLDSPSVMQTRPASEFMQFVNAPERMPREVEFFILYGDIYFQLDLRIFGLRLVRHRESFGDLLIPVQSSSSLPNAPFTAHVFETQLGGHIRIGRHTHMSDHADMIAPLHGGLLPPTSHGRLRRNPDVQRKVLEILTA